MKNYVGFCLNGRDSYNDKNIKYLGFNIKQKCIHNRIIVIVLDWLIDSFNIFCICKKYIKIKILSFYVKIYIFFYKNGRIVSINVNIKYYEI